MKKINILAFLLLLFVLPSCESDVETEEEKDETTEEETVIEETVIEEPTAEDLYFSAFFNASY